MLKRVVCLCLALSQMGCQSVYRFRCTSRPSEAGVLVGEEMLGETPCDVEIAKDSDLIQDDKIEFRFCLPDGREKTKVVDLHDFESGNPLADIVAAPFIAGGFVLLAVALDDEDDEDSVAGSDDEDDDDRLTMGLVGAGSLGAGIGLHHLLGGKFEDSRVHKVDVNFDEIPDEQQSQVLPAQENDPQ